MNSTVTVASLAVFLVVVAAYPSSEPPSTLTPSSSSAASPKCSAVEVSKCSTFYSSAQMPNMFGENSQTKAGENLRDLLNKLGSTNKLVTSFLCSVYIPPCPTGSKVKAAQWPLPCRGLCEEALAGSRGAMIGDQTDGFPVTCHILPTHNCFAFDGVSSLKFRKSHLPPVHKRRIQTGEVARFAPLEVELGFHDESDDVTDDDEFKVEVVTLNSGDIPARRYDIADLGDPTLFQGWVDVQGTGAANDYCRVVGRRKRRFMSCNLAGQSGQGHHYVSKLGFDPGHIGTWFMRDMDGDGRDDYCRCVGSSARSHVTCMKAGERGFHGSSTQGGQEHSFRLPNTEHCVDRLVNQVFGE